jgi:hypothetical protein
MRNLEIYFFFHGLGELPRDGLPGFRWLLVATVFGLVHIISTEASSLIQRRPAWRSSARRAADLKSGGPRYLPLAATQNSDFRFRIPNSRSRNENSSLARFLAA